MRSPFDVLVVGAGPGGYVAAIRASQLGLRTCVIERDAQMGGRCLREACVPAKAVLRAADALTEVHRASQFGVRVHDPELDLSAVWQRRDSIIDELAAGVHHLLKRHRVEVVHGDASLTAQGTVVVDDEELVASTAVILATGSVPVAPPGVELGGRVLDTAAAWRIDDLPRSMVIVGAGASGVELASAFARFGVVVELVDRAATILPAEEPEVSSLVLRALEAEGVRVSVCASIDDVADVGSTVSLAIGGERRRVDLLVVATGRAPDIATGTPLEVGADGRILIDGSCRTSMAGVYAIGDLVSGPALAHRASQDAIVAAETAAGRNVARPDPHLIPRAVYCDPPVASVGLTETEASARSMPITIGRAPYAAVGASVIQGLAGFVKIVACETYGEILGAHVVGPRAPELLQGIVDVMAADGGIDELAQAVHLHPALPEVVSEAARAALGWATHA